jgi:putative copper export protein
MDILNNKIFFMIETSNTGKGLILFSRALLTLLSVFASALVFAQEATKSVDVNINSGGGSSFFGNTWVWVVGVAVFILLLVALLRGNGRRSV